MYGLGGRYATALYSAASKEKQLDIVDKELAALQVRIQHQLEINKFCEKQLTAQNWF